MVKFGVEVGLFLLLMSVSFAAPISSCGSFNASSYLTQDLTFPSGTCLTYRFDTNAPMQMTLDCRGHQIRATTAAFSTAIEKGGNPSATGDEQDLIIKNCRIQNVSRGLVSNVYGVHSIFLTNTSFLSISDRVFYNLAYVKYFLTNVTAVASPNAVIAQLYSISELHAVNSSLTGSNKYLLNTAIPFIETMNTTLPYPLNVQSDLEGDPDTFYFREMQMPWFKVILWNGSAAPMARLNISNSSGFKYYSEMITDQQGRTRPLPLNESTWRSPSVPYTPFLENAENPYTITVNWKPGFNTTGKVIVNQSREILIILMPPRPTIVSNGSGATGSFIFEDLLLEWKAAEGTHPTKYWLDAWVNGAHSDLLPIGGMDMGTATSINLVSDGIEVLMKDGTWKWAVAAEIDGVKYWSQNSTIIKKTGATLLTPPNGKIVQANEIFSWQPITGAKNYVLKLDGFFPTSYYFPLNSQSATFVLTQPYYNLLQSGKTYTWAIAGTGLGYNLVDTDVRLSKLAYGYSRTFKK